MTCPPCTHDCNQGETCPAKSKQAIAELESRKPVAWEQFHGHMAGPFYQEPPQRTWVGLTDEEREEIHGSTKSPYLDLIVVEAKLKEKNT